MVVIKVHGTHLPSYMYIIFCMVDFHSQRRGRKEKKPALEQRSLTAYIDMLKRSVVGGSSCRYIDQESERKRMERRGIKEDIVSK